MPFLSVNFPSIWSPFNAPITVPFLSCKLEPEIIPPMSSFLFDPSAWASPPHNFKLLDKIILKVPVFGCVVLNLPSNPSIKAVDVSFIKLKLAFGCPGILDEVMVGLWPVLATEKLMVNGCPLSVPVKGATYATPAVHATDDVRVAEPHQLSLPQLWYCLHCQCQIV